MSRSTNERPLHNINEFKGLMTADNAYEIGVDAQTIATNVDITRKNKIKRRSGFVNKVTAAITAAWANDRSMLYQSGTTLTSVDSTYATAVVRTGLTASTQLRAYQIKDIIYYSNGYEVGCIENGVDRTLGIRSPTRAVLTATTGGEMPLGIYQVAVSYVRDDGFESGVILPATSVTLAGGNTAIAVGSVPANGAMLVNYYVTQANGDVFYFAGQGPTGVSTTLSANPSLLRRSMKARNTNPPLPFTQIEQYNGRILYAIGDTLYFSDPFAYEQVDYAKGFIPFQNEITMIAVVDDGFFIGTTEDTYFLSGDRVGELDLTSVADYGVVVDTRSYLDGAVVGAESTTTKKTPAWISTKGMCIGFQDGSMQNVTESTVILPKGSTGASFFRQENGQNHFISVIRS
jgi:hypothetical protein